MARRSRMSRSGYTTAPAPGEMIPSTAMPGRGSPGCARTGFAPVAMFSQMPRGNSALPTWLIRPPSANMRCAASSRRRWSMWLSARIWDARLLTRRCTMSSRMRRLARKLPSSCWTSWARVCPDPASWSRRRGSRPSRWCGVRTFITSILPKRIAAATCPRSSPLSSCAMK